MEETIAPERLAEDIRDIYLLLNRNYTGYQALGRMKAGNVRLEEIFPKAELGRFRRCLAQLRAMRSSYSESQGLSFSGSFDFRRDNAEVDQIRYAQEKVISSVSARIMENPFIRILSLGIGNGETCSRYLDGFRGEITGLDIHGGYLNQAKGRIPSLSKVVFDLNSLPEKKIPLPASHFDLIECTMAAHHIERFDFLASESARLLKKGGAFIYADLVDKTATEKKMTFSEVHRHPKFHGMEFFRPSQETKKIIRQYLRITGYERIGPGIMFLSAEK